MAGINRKGWETLTISLRKELKDKFEELFNDLGYNSKAEFLTDLLENIQEQTQINPDEINITKITDDPEPQPIKLKENEILVTLNPIQLQALSQPFEFEEFIDIANRNTEEALQKKDFWTGALKCPMFFLRLEPEADKKVNMGTLLINVFMAHIANDKFAGLVDLKKLQEKGLKLKAEEEKASSSK